MAEVKSFKAVLLKSPGNAELTELPIPELTPTQVLVKMGYSQINPSDMGAFNRGFSYGKTEGVLGFDGSGTVVKTGDKVPPGYLNSKVSCGVSPGLIYGAWGEYFIGDFFSVLLIKEDLTLEQASALVTNPLSVVAMIHEVQKRGLKSAAMYPCTSQLGKQFNLLTAKLGIPVINIVRSAGRVKQAEEEFGMKNVLAFDDPEFATKYGELCKQLDVKIAFESVAGSVTMKILTPMPLGSTVVNFGALEGGDITDVKVSTLMVQDKTIKSFLLVHYMREIGAKVGEVHHEMIQKNYHDCFKVSSPEIIELKDWKEAMEKAKHEQTNKKILLKLH